MVKFAKSSKADISESEIQKAFEENLNEVEEGLEYIGSFVHVGTGIIDVLAVDQMDNAVIIEFKKMGDFDESALIQLMDYYSWFVIDENHMNHLKEIIQKKKPEFSSINDIRLIAVVTQVSDRVKNACWALSPDIKLITYSIFEDKNNEPHVIHKEILDTSKGGEKLVKPPKTEEDHFKKAPKMKPLYDKLKEKILEIGDDIVFNPAPQAYIGVRKTRNFLAFHVYSYYISMDLHINPRDVNFNKKIMEYQNDQWCYIEIDKETDIDDELIRTIRIVYDKN